MLHQPFFLLEPDSSWSHNKLSLYENVFNRSFYLYHSTIKVLL